MRRAGKGLWAGILVTALLLTGAAAAETYRVEALDGEITFETEGYSILTRDTAPEDPVLALLGMTPEQASAFMEENNLYLDAICNDLSHELTVGVDTGEDYETIFNYSLLSESLRKETGAELQKEFEKQGYLTQDISWYEGAEAVWLVIELDMPHDMGRTLQYQTIHNGKMIAISTPATGQPLTDEIRGQLKAMADGIHFTRTDPVPQAVQEMYQQQESNFWGHVLRYAIIGALVGAVVGGCWELLSKRSEKRKRTKDAQSVGGEGEAEGNDECGQ